MKISPKDPRSAAQRARDTASIVGSLKHEGYVPTPEAEVIHARVASGRITNRGGDRDFPAADFGEGVMTENKKSLQPLRPWVGRFVVSATDEPVGAATIYG